jgi:D-lactate dehydrogenase
MYTLAKGTDASFYRLVPKMVVRVESEHEVVHMIKSCSRLGIPLTFKAGGTSLSGQTITDTVLVETGDGLSGFSVIDDGRSVNLQCGITGGMVNIRLARYKRKIGPDPASIASARIGGIVANNASGGALGIKQNSYNTLRGMRFVLSDGSVVDTRIDESRKQFSIAHPEMVEGISRLATRIKSDRNLISKIRHKYEIKNTTGYGINALIDFEDPVDIIAHLMVGSEGTLGFISEVSLETVEDFSLKATSLVFLPSLRAACEIIPALKACSIAAAELMDRNALRSVEDKSGMPEELKQLNDEAAALLIETAANTPEELEVQVSELKEVLTDANPIYPVNFTSDPILYEKLWKVRKGLFTSAAATRPAGTACIIEDLAFRHDVLADATESLKILIDQYHYTGSVIWGHILDGNIHFVIMPDFREPGSIENYRLFMQDLADMTIKRFDGSLKGEHGTGRNMAPFVQQEWGDELYSIMQEIKKIMDPLNILNPGVLINPDPLVHLKHTKLFTPSHDLVDKCIECGFCEYNCPSKNLTLTPRQRIVVYRMLTALSESGQDKRLYKHIRKNFNYHGDATCATDGLCALNCPVDINTGTLIKELRYCYHNWFSKWIAAMIADHMKTAIRVVRFLLNMTGAVHSLLGSKTMSAISGGLRKLSLGALPLWNPYMPRGAGKMMLHPDAFSGKDKVVYFPSCINRSMGKSSDYRSEPGLVEKTDALLRKAGFEVIYPENLENLCCGMAFSSKGFKLQGEQKARELEAALLKATDQGKIPVYCDMSPCLFTMRETLSPELSLLEPVEFILRFFPQRLVFHQLPKTITVHSTCSNTKMGLEKKLAELARMCAKEVIVPDEIGCCGWAGDRGFTRPELNTSALALLGTQLPAHVSEGYSTSRTCEIGLSLHGGISYKSIVYLVDEATKSL